MSISPVTSSMDAAQLAAPRSKSIQRRTTRQVAMRLETIRVALSNAQHDPDIAGTIARYGYTQAHLADGQALLDAAVLQHHRQQLLRGEAKQAVEAQRNAFATASAVFAEIRKLARVAFKQQPSMLHMLGIADRRKRAYATWTMQAGTFYANTMDQPAVVERLALYGVSRERLIEGKRLLTQTELCAEITTRTSGAAQQVTQLRNLALENLNAWYAEFAAVARIVCAAQPLLIERLGI